MGMNGLFLAPNPFARAPGNDMFCANNCQIVPSGSFCSAASAILICFWSQDLWLGLRRWFSFPGSLVPDGLKLLKDQGEQYNESENSQKNENSLTERMHLF